MHNQDRRPMHRHNILLVTKGQANAMRGLFTPPSKLLPVADDKKKELGRDIRFWIATKYFRRKITKFDDLTLGDWKTVRMEAYQDWQSQNWDETQSWKAMIRLWTTEYIQEVLGQISMFE